MKDYYHIIKAYPKAIAYGFLHTFYSSFGQTFFIAFFGAAILKDFQLSSTAYGSIYAGVTLISSFTLSFFGEVLDRFNYKIISVFVGLGLALGAFTMSKADTVYVLALGLFLIRLFGQGFGPLTASTLMAKFFEKTRGRSLALSSLGIPFGEALLPIVLIQPLLITNNWQEAWRIFSLLILLSFPLISIFLSYNIKGENLVPTKPTKKTKKISRLKLFKDKRFFLLIPTASMNAFILTALFFHLVYVNSEKNWTATLAASGFLAFGITRAISNLISGDLIDRFSVFTLIKFYLIPIILGVASLIFPFDSLGTYLFFIFCGVSVGFSGNLFTAIWAEIYGTEFLGTIRGLASTCVILSTAISPPLLGLMIDSGYSIQSVAISILAIIFISYFLLLLHPMRKKKN